MIAKQQRCVRVDAAELGAFARALGRALKLPLSAFTAALVTDRQIAALNRRYRHRRRATDVLSFPAAGANGYRGDVVLSVETARRQARRCRHSLGTELKFLLLHGVLHLLGYDHETDNGRMDRRERALRRRLGLE